MSAPATIRPVIEITARAREALLAHVDAPGGKARYLRIHVGRG